MIDYEAKPAGRRRRNALLSLVAAAFIAGAVVADRLVPASRSPGAAAAQVTQTGVWGCPLVSAGKLGGWLNLANAGLRPASVRVRWIVMGVRPAEFGLRLLPGQATSLRAPVSGDRAVAAVVEWAGGEVVVSRSAPASALAGRTVAVGSACSLGGERLLAFVGGRTLNAETRLWVLNPSSADALIDISLLIEGDEFQPESLKRRVVRGRSTFFIRAGDFSFDHQLIGMVVRTTTGTVVADAMVLTATGADLIPAGPPRTSLAVAGEPLRNGHVDIVAVGEDPATVVSSTLTAKGQSSTIAFPSGLDPGSPVEVGIRGGGAMAFSLVGREGSPFVATLAWSPPIPGGSDFAISPPLPVSTRWIGVAGPPASGAGLRLVLANPSGGPVVARTRVLTQSGQAAAGALASVSLLPGRSAVFPLAVRGEAVGVEVVSSGPIVVTVVGTGGRDATAFTYAIGASPAPGRRRPSVVLDPGAGVSN